MRATMKISFVLLALLCGMDNFSLAQTTCATDGSSASVVVTSDTYNNMPVWKIKSSGCPNWDWSKQSTPNTAKVVNTEAIILKNPIICKNPLYIGRQQKSVMGTVGLLMNGAALFGDGDAQKQDAYINEGKTMDDCLGHVAMDTYHTHTIPGGCCLTKETNTTHSPVVAIMADGIPLYGPFGDNGVPPTDLDECRGHTDSLNFYHYHATSTLTAPYTVGCLKGCVINNFAGNQQFKNYVGIDPAEKQYNYSSLKLTWDASPVSPSTIANCPYKYAPGAPAPSPSSPSPPSGNTANMGGLPSTVPGGNVPGKFPDGKFPVGKFPGRRMKL